jgi:hypothetical protein
MPPRSLRSAEPLVQNCYAATNLGVASALPPRCLRDASALLPRCHIIAVPSQLLCGIMPQLIRRAALTGDAVEGKSSTGTCN